MRDLIEYNPVAPINKWTYRKADGTLNRYSDLWQTHKTWTKNEAGRRQHEPTNNGHMPELGTDERRAFIRDLIEQEGQ